jgi:tetratricopeptide (TPR) repeat protein
VVGNPKFKDSFEALRILAQIKGRLGKAFESVELFKRVLELNPKDFEANIEIGQVHEQNDPKTAIVFYEKALNIIQENIAEKSMKLVPPELLVTIGTLRLEIGKTQEAKSAYEQAI